MTDHSCLATTADAKQTPPVGADALHPAQGGRRLSACGVFAGIPSADRELTQKAHPSPQGSQGRMLIEQMIQHHFEIM